VAYTEGSIQIRLNDTVLVLEAEGSVVELLTRRVSGKHERRSVIGCRDSQGKKDTAHIVWSGILHCIQDKKDG